MSYFNFFSQYSGQRGEKKDAGKAWLTIFLIAAVLACGCVYLYYSSMCNGYKSQLDFLDDIKGDPGFQEQHEVALKVSGQISGAEKEYNFVELLDDYTVDVSTSNENLFKFIDGCMTKDAQLERIEVSGNEVKLNGQTSNVTDLTTIERNFRKSDAVSSVFINEVENKGDEGDEDEGDKGDELIAFECELRLNGGAILDD